MLTVFASSDETVLLTMLPAELNNSSHGHIKLQTPGTLLIMGENWEINSSLKFFQPLK